MSGPGVKFMYTPANDLSAMRHFYGDLVGLDEIYFSEEEGVLAYDCGGFQFSVFTAPSAVPMPAGWATQPGWDGETVAATSWSVELDDDGFRRAVDALRDAGVEALHAAPEWVGYWSLPVRDPMGNTVEIACPPLHPPASTKWRE